MKYIQFDIMLNKFLYILNIDEINNMYQLYVYVSIYFFIFVFVFYVNTHISFIARLTGGFIIFGGGFIQ